MKKTVSSYRAYVLLLLAVVVVAACTDLKPRVMELEKIASDYEMERDALEEENRLLKEIAGPLPASLDQFFPPQAPAPVFLFEMFALTGPFEGIIVDLQQGDKTGMQANYEAFASQYQKLAGMVPEWTERYPMEPVEALGEALATGDPAQIGLAIGGVGQV